MSAQPASRVRPTSLLARLLLPGLLLSACHKDELPAQLADCADDDCKVAWVDQHMEAEPDRVVDAVASEPDATTRLALVTVLASKHPAQLVHRCVKIAPGPARDRCDALNTRPHLWQVSIPGEVDGTDVDANALIGLQLSDAARTRWNDVQVVAAPCQSGSPTCVRDAAIMAAKAADPQRAAGLCAQNTAERWRAECMFQAGEQAALADLARGLAVGADLCLGAEPYADRCLIHLTWAIAGGAPDALSGDAAEWDPIVTGIAGGFRVLSNQDPVLAEEWRQRAWATALRAAYEQVIRVTGTPLTVLPEDARPYIVAGAAWRLLKLESGQERSLEDWGRRLEEVLNDTAPGPRRKRDMPTRNAFSVVDRWQTRTPEDASFQRVSWLGTAHRALGDDPRSERLICILEAAAQATPPLVGLLRQGARDDDPVVSWTARRLLPQVHQNTGGSGPG